jgi:hypothetical protein
VRRLEGSFWKAGKGSEPGPEKVMGSPLYEMDNPAALSSGREYIGVFGGGAFPLPPFAEK